MYDSWSSDVWDLIAWLGSYPGATCVGYESGAKVFRSTITKDEMIDLDQFGSKRSARTIDRREGLLESQSAGK